VDEFVGQCGTLASLIGFGFGYDSLTGRKLATAGRKPPKLVHNMVFSMPKGTPPDKLYEAVRRFAMEKLALQHRYAMALPAEQGYPHVHVVLKAVSEHGERLNSVCIRGKGRCIARATFLARRPPILAPR
jgi:hypothetical protein